MVERRVVVENALGVHARPACEISRVASRFRSEISLECNGVKADARSIIGVMTLAAPKGATVVIRARGHDEDEAVEALVKLFADKFNEE